jgi:hypothetical protein
VLLLIRTPGASLRPRQQRIKPARVERTHPLHGALRVESQRVIDRSAVDAKTQQAEFLAARRRCIGSLARGAMHQRVDLLDEFHSSTHGGQRA